MILDACTRSSLFTESILINLNLNFEFVGKWMNRWMMNGQINGRMDEWTDETKDGWMKRRMDEKTDG